MKNRKKWLVMLCLFLLVGSYVRYYQNSIQRVQLSVQAENNLKEPVFYKNDLKYGDLSRKVRGEISRQEFESWSTWKDLDASFAILQPPDKGKTVYVFQVPLSAGLAVVCYELELTGFKLRYVEVRP